MVGIFTGDQAVNANAIEVMELLPALSAKLERVILPGIALEQLPQEYERLLSGKSRLLKTIVKP
jgi:hypothetical protein